MTIKFHKEYEKWGKFSNYFKTPIKVRIAAEIDEDGKTVWNKGALTENLQFSSREALFHALKFTQPGNVKVEIIRSFSSKEPNEARDEAAKLAKRNEFNNLNWWYGGSFSQPGYNVKAMLWTIWQALKQNENLREELLKSGDEELVENTQIASYNDDFWGNGKHGGGRNELGKALMKLRTRLRREKPKWDKKHQEAIFQMIDYWNSKKFPLINKDKYVSDNNYKEMRVFLDKAVRENYPNESHSCSWEKFIYQELILEGDKCLKYFKKKIDEYHKISNVPADSNEKVLQKPSVFHDEGSQKEDKIEQSLSNNAEGQSQTEKKEGKVLINKNPQNSERKDKKNWVIILLLISGSLLIIACFLFFKFWSKSRKEAK